MITPKEIESKLKSIKPILKKEFGIDQIGYFGSFAIGDYHDGSDVDIIIKYKKGMGWKFFDLKDYLESVLNRSIDLVTEQSIKKQWRDSIMAQVKYL